MPLDRVPTSDDPSSSRREPPRPEASNRTAVAGRELLHAMGEDLAAVGRRLRSAFSRAERIGPPPLGGVASLIGTLLKGIIAAAAIGALLVTAAVLWVVSDIPFNSAIADATEREILLEASDGKPLGRVGPLKISNARREEFPRQVVAAVLSVEDRRFYDHWGIDLPAILRAMHRNYNAGAIVEGGSTITQQLVKMRLVGSERTFGRKLREALAALWLETHLGKDEILTRYLNSVYMGAGAQGIPAGAKLYFDKAMADLTLPEAALLAGLIKAPSRFNPLQDLEAAQQRAAIVLDTMVENGVLDAQAAQQAKAAPARLAHPVLNAQAAPWFSDWVAQEAQDVTGNFTGTMRMRTTLDPRLQALAERAVADGLRKAAPRNVRQAALVAMRRDGAVVAMVGGRDYKESQFNRAVQARRQAGSAFKTFVYLAALRNGYGAHHTVDASSLDINGWEPDNFGGREYGSITLADAFARSVNTAAVRLALDVGIDQVIAAARDLGIKSPLPSVPSLALGSAEVSLLELTAAYAGISARRMPVQPWGVASFAAPGAGRTMSVGAPLASQRPLAAADQMTALLTLPVQRGTARAAALDGFAAGKTGTTQNHKDAWFIGFNDSLVVGVWAGNDDGTPMQGVTGGTVPAGIWKAFMEGGGSPGIASARPPGLEQASTGPSLRVGTSDQPAMDVHSQEEEYVRCDVRYCATRYQSFRASDCTYQPYSGPRTRCDRVSPSFRHASVASDGAASADGAEEPASARCNIEICAGAYSSFRASDCTYQPYDGGPRRMCTR